jgi:hypothetical protein
MQDVPTLGAELCTHTALAIVLALAPSGCGASAPPVDPVPASPVAPEAPAVERAAGNRSLYLATLTAAELSLRVHETDGARHWLEQSPPDQRGWEWRYLAALSDQAAKRFAAAESPLTDISVSPDGRLLAVGAGDGTTLLLDAVPARRAAAGLVGA